MAKSDEQGEPAEQRRPRGEQTMINRAFPKDTNAAGDIFGGWLMSQLDLAGAVAAEWRAKGRVATVGVEAMRFHRPVRVGDLLGCYAEIQRVGTTSITVRVEAWVLHWRAGDEMVKVTEGTYTYVALDESGNKRPVDQE